MATIAAATLLLLAGLFSQQQARANQLDALMLPGDGAGGSKVHLTAFRNIEISYPAGSSLSRLLDGVNDEIELETADAAQVIRTINEAIFREQKSPVTIAENATVTYVAKIKGYPERAQISYKIDIEGSIAGHVLQEEMVVEAEDGDGDGNNSSSSSSSSPAIVDLDWRSFSVEQPLMMEVAERGATIDINSPAGALAVLAPELAERLLAAPEAEAIMRDPVLDFGRFDLPMKSWHFLFDVTGEQLKNYGVFIPGEGGTVSIHSIGESSFREGTYLPEEKDAEFQVDGARVKMHASTPPPSGQITIAGYSRIQESNGTEVSLVSSRHSGTVDPFGFQMQVLLMLGGMMGAIAVFVLYKSRR